MEERSEPKIPRRDTINALCDELTQLSLIIAEGRKLDADMRDELHQRLPILRQLLADLEQGMTSEEPDSAELEALYGISQAIGSSLDLTEVLNEVMDQIIGLTGAERSFLMLHDLGTGELEFRAARNVDRETIDSSSFEISRSIARQVAASGEAVVTTNAQMDPRFKTRDSVIGYSLRSILCAPLRARGRITGVIYADNRVRTGLFSDRDRDLLTAFASQAAVAIENARLFESVSDAKALMDSIFASITSGVITTDIEGQITLVNRAAQRILQVASPAALGSTLADASPALESELRPLVERVRTDGEAVVDAEIDLSLPGRGPVNLRTSLSPLKDVDDETQGLAVVVDDLTEQRRLETVSQMFRRYVSPAVIEQLLENPSELKLGGQRQEITSLFADIRGFTDFSQQHDPETLVEVLNQYLDVAAKAVLSEEGTLDKFMGDAVVALFNAPLPQADHLLRAARAAVRMQQGVAQLHRSLRSEYRLGYGVGITVGEAVVGNIGTAQQMNYTAIGPSVNLARRLQEAAAPGQILLARTAYERVRTLVEARPLSPITAQGISEPVEVYELLGLQ